MYTSKIRRKSNELVPTNGSPEQFQSGLVYFQQFEEHLFDIFLVVIIIITTLTKLKLSFHAQITTFEKYVMGCSSICTREQTQLL